MVEPWITLPSVPAGSGRGASFRVGGKGAMEGNAAIPYLALARLRDAGLPLHLVRAEPFGGLPYLATFGFKSRVRCPSFSSAWRGRGSG